MIDLIDVLVEEKAKAEHSLIVLLKYWRDMPGFSEQNEYLRGKLARIEAAIERFKVGKQGVCLSCGQALADKRLKKIPYAEHCCNCQHEVDLLINEFERASLASRE